MVLHQLGIDIMELCYTHSGRLPNIWVLILQTFPQRLAEVLCDLVHTDAAHCTNSKGPDKRVRVFTVLVGWFKEVFVNILDYLNISNHDVVHYTTLY